ncbi:hypothetical protein DRQ53_09850 [bacterium]|nr:MAG: hypothetical protein DRQ32_05330 [bacterium]RKZ15124.1 MAG: hypothetical protein DRQ53_09850 [bacterium]
MSRFRFEILMGALFLALTLLFSLSAAADETAELADRVDVLAEELARLREQMAIPETDAELGSVYGMGPAASKVYMGRGGVAVGGYGEFYFENTIDGNNTADMYRFITYIGYKFSDRIVMNTELEFEHATTSANYQGKAGSVSVEFSYLDFLLNDHFNIRAGNLLVPMGFINQLHEPPYYRGNIRPTIERAIIPSTWRELGAGAHGQITSSLRYTGYVLNGMNGANFSEDGVRGGRQKGNRAIMNDIGVVGALALETTRAGLTASGYYGGADQNLVLDAMDQMISVKNWIGEAHAWWRGSGLELRGLVALSGVDGAGDLGLAHKDSDGVADPITIPEQQFGWYVEAGYDVAPLLSDQPGFRLEPWFRYEDFDLHHSVADGFTPSDSKDRQSITAGLQFMPHAQVVIKAEFEHLTTANDADDSVDEFRLGAGFVF